MRTVLVALLALASPALHAEIWKCVDADGSIRFTNVRAETKGCQALNLDPAPPKSAPRTAAKGAAPAASTPADFPRVDAPTQRARDAERRQILEHELANEERLLADSRRRVTEQEAARTGAEALPALKKQVALHEANVANIRRELANIR